MLVVRYSIAQLLAEVSYNRNRFPRHWKKGNAADIAEYEEDKRDRERYFAMLAEQRAQAERDGKTADASQLEAGIPKPAPRIYVPPVAGY